MCDIPAAELADFFDEALIAHMGVHRLRICLTMRDFSPLRAELVRRLNRARIVVVAWIVRDEHDSARDYRMHDAALLGERYREFLQWSTQHGLGWDAIGIDIEPDIRDAVRFGDQPTVDVNTLVRRIANRWHIDAATSDYATVVTQMRADGFAVESYEIPFVRDDRVSGSTIARRLLGLPDLAADRTVIQLYSSNVRPYGPGLIATYASEASSVLIGSIAADGHNRPLSENELLRDLGHVAACGVTHIYIADMQAVYAVPGLADLIVAQAWRTQTLPPTDEVHHQVSRMRAGVRALLWAGARPAVLLPLLIPVLLLIRRMLRVSANHNTGTTERKSL
jgi:hypothetical protein